MNDLQSFLDDLPTWVQLIAFAAIAAVGIGVGKKRSTRLRSKPQGKPGPKRFAQQTLNAEQTSPGQTGPHATSEMTSAEIRELQPSYEPSTDGDPDPGEVIWTWVPFIENDGRGKDRPVLILARVDSQTVAGCYLSTKQHKNYISVGTGKWDSQGRQSYLNPLRVLRVSNEGMRREGAIFPQKQYEKAMTEIIDCHRNRT